ncbi:MAG TPA: virulence factor [Candidatus Competibacteraceae bacterium]|nr:virulence factor [Candidatus Competibacteraceae bacterium]
MAAKLITVYWRDIPAQVIVKKGRDSAKVQLSDRFQVAIDRAAMRAGKGSSDAYLEDWKRLSRDCGDDLEAEAAAEAARLEAAYDDARLERIVRGKGLDPDLPVPGPDSDA